MRGRIESYDDQTGQGAVRGEDGKTYAFSRSVVHDVDRIEIGSNLRFVGEKGVVAEAAPLDEVPLNAQGWDDPPPQIEELDPRPELNLLQYWLKCFILCFRPIGRASPNELLSFHAINFIIFMGVMSALVFLGADADVSGSVALALFALTLPATLSVTVRRLHDAGYSGWFVLVVMLPVFGWIMLIFVLLRESQRHTNKYGRHPRASPASIPAVA